MHFCGEPSSALTAGGVLASVVPASFLESKSAEIIRTHIARSGEFRIHLIGQFDFDYFDASVQPAFIVVSRSQRPTPVRILIAKKTYEDAAIRSLRIQSPEEASVEPGFELYNAEQHDLSPRRWTPPPRRVVQLIQAISQNTLTTVADLFAPHLGIRTGNKSVFVVGQGELSRFCKTQSEQAYFRQIADKIENAIIQPTDFVFYPYGMMGRCCCPPRMR